MNHIFGPNGTAVEAFFSHLQSATHQQIIDFAGHFHDANLGARNAAADQLRQTAHHAGRAAALGAARDLAEHVARACAQRVGGAAGHTLQVWLVRAARSTAAYLVLADMDEVRHWQPVAEHTAKQLFTLPLVPWAAAAASRQVDPIAPPYT